MEFARHAPGLKGDEDIAAAVWEAFEMHEVQIDSLTQLIGYVASGLVLTTFCFSNPIRLRLFALASNIAFIAYGCFGEVYPVMLLHIVLVPINLFHLARLLQTSERMAMLMARCRYANRRLA
jgi:hypothetical protein